MKTVFVVKGFLLGEDDYVACICGNKDAAESRAIMLGREDEHNYQYYVEEWEVLE